MADFAHIGITMEEAGKALQRLPPLSPAESKLIAWRLSWRGWLWTQAYWWSGRRLTWLER